MCDLIPGDLAKGLQKSDGDPQLSCMYSDTVDHQFVSVHVYNSSWNIDPEDPDGSGTTEKFDELKVDGRTAFGWIAGSSESATVAFDVGEGAVFVAYNNEGKSNAEAMKVAVSFAERVSVALRNGEKVDGAVEPPPSTTAAKIPEGERGWPGVVCDAMPAELVESMEASRGYEDQSCRLKMDTADGFTNIDLSKRIAFDPEDPSIGTGVKVEEESFDGRTAYSWLSDGGRVPTAYVVFATGERESAEVRVAIADVENPVDPEAVRAEALKLAETIAPKLPQP